MLSLTARKPLNRWANDRISPGVVGSVGDVNLQSRLKSSLPGEIRWEKETYGRNEPSFGANVSDGMHQSYASGGGPAKTVDGFIGGGRDMRTNVGWRFENLKPEDRADEPIVGEMPQLSWRMNLASVKNQQRTGQLFKFRPGGLIDPPTGVPRGGKQPLVVGVDGGTQIFNGSPSQTTLAFGPGNDRFDVSGGLGRLRTSRNEINGVKGRMKGK